MTTKTTGAEILRFYNDSEFWPDGVWHEDEVVTVDGAEWLRELSAIPDGAVVAVSHGAVFSDGDSAAPWGDGDGPSFETHFKHWRKKQATAVGTFECPKDKLQAVKAAIKAAGGKPA